MEILLEEIEITERTLGYHKIIFNCESCNKELNRKFRDYKISKLCKSCKTKQTNLDRYGVENAYQSKEIQERIKKTNLDRYGVEFASQTENNRNSNRKESSRKKASLKTKQTKLEKYGSENYNNINKIKQTKLEKYGSENYNNQEKFKLTMKKRYFGEYTLSSSLRNKVLKCKLDKYGDENYNNPSKSKSTKLERYGNEKYNNREKAKYTTIKQYGVDHVSKIFEFRENNSKKQREKFINLLFNSNRLNDLVVPNFKEEDYKKSRDIYSWRCCKCDNIFEDDIYSGSIPRCKKCFPLYKQTSIQEKEIAKYITDIGFEIEENSRSIISPLEIDIFIPSLKLAIEFNGMYWHSIEADTEKNYHLIKTEKCKNLGIRLLHLYENEEYKDKINNFLYHVLSEEKEIYLNRDEGLELLYLNNKYTITEVIEPQLFKIQNYNLYNSGFLLLKKSSQ